MNRAFVNFRRFTGATLSACAHTVSRNAAACLGHYDKYGTLEVGKQADMVLLHPKTGEVQLTIIGGTVAYKR